jgi:hypothetical protein
MSNRLRVLLGRVAFPSIALGSSLLLLGCSVLVGLVKLVYLSTAERTLSRQLATSAFELSKERAATLAAKEKEEQLQLQKQEELERNARYFDDVPLVVSTLDGKGKLVGFARLAQPNGTAQYSFLVKNGDNEAGISGTISNRDGRLTYSDDYSTPSELRTSGEVAHSKSGGSRLRIDFVVTGASSEKFRIGDTFYAEFVLPESPGGSV